MLEKCCSYLKQCRNNVAMLVCAKNGRCESSPVTSPLTSLQALVYHLVNSFGLPFWVTMTVLNGSTMFHKSWLHIQSNFGLSLHGLAPRTCSSFFLAIIIPI